MFRQVQDFLNAYDQGVTRTQKVLAALDDATLHKPVAPGYRTLGQLAWHIVTTVPEMMGRTGLGLSGVDPHSVPPATAAAVQEGYRKVSSELRAAVAKDWKDETLLKVDELYGEKWPRGITLSVLMGHETHHVGQMTVLLRLAGRKVPGIMGPSKEEWKQFGMEEPAY
jgi:uncharacterized damage-inducible protein DinB